MNEVVYGYLLKSGLKNAAKELQKEAKLDSKKVKENDVLTTIYNEYKKTNKTTAKKEESSDDESSDDSDDDKPPAKKPVSAPVSAKKPAAKKEESSDDDSSSSDDSDDDKPPAKKPTPAPVSAKKPVAKKEESSDDSSSSSDDSDDDKPPAKKPAPAAASAKKPAAPAPAPTSSAKKPAAKKEESSDDSSSSSDDSDDDKPPAKKPVSAPVSAKKPAAKKEESSDDDSSSSSSDDSDDEDDKPPAKKPTSAAKPAAAPKIETNTTASTGEHKIYVKGLPWTANEKEVKDFFKGCGKIATCELPLDESGRSSGTAYVTFSQRSELEKALELDEQTWPNSERWLKIMESSGRTPRNSSGVVGVKPEGCNTVFIGNLPWDVEEDQLRTIFSECGEIASIRFATGEDGSFRGFGHVEFVDGDSVDAAVQCAGTDVNGRAIRVDFAPPRNRDRDSGSPRDGGRGGGRGRGDGGRGRGGGRGGGGRGRGGGDFINKGKGSIVAPQGKKMSFDE